MSIDHYLKGLLQSYDDLGIVNGFGQNMFPSRDDIRGILNTIKEVLFPGFMTTQTNNTSLEELTRERLLFLETAVQKTFLNTFVWAAGKSNKDDLSELEAQVALIAADFFTYLPELRRTLRLDAQAIYEGDPASKSETEIILAYPGFQAIMTYRIAHFFYNKQVPLVPRLLSEIVHSETGIDIHPGAKIGHHFFIDHGTGIVIGETSEIGNHVKLYQGVTLGAFSVSKNSTKGKRHPTLKDHVTVYARSTILGGDTIIGHHCVVGGNVWLTESLEDYSKIYLAPDFKQIFKVQKPK